MTSAINSGSSAINTPISSSTKSIEAKTPKERRQEVHAAMHKTLMDAISDTCVSMIKSHRDRLHRQYKIIEERRASRG